MNKGARLNQVRDKLDELRFYQKAMELWDNCWSDTEIMKQDFRGKEIARQLIRSVGSISANIEEGFGRGFGKEYPQFLRIARGSARESKGWLSEIKVSFAPGNHRSTNTRIDSITRMITATIKTLENRK